MNARAAAFLLSLLALAVGAGLVVGGLATVLVGIGVGLMVAAGGGVAACFLLESIPPKG